ncbi:MAG TPA: toxin-antitoxin system HicB family antitoxin, partial [Vampirovibrionales bacterium]
MSELTLKLPETLHQQLTILATNEGVSLNQYIVLALTRQAAFSSMIQKDSETELERQQQELQSLVQKLGQASPSEIES